MLMLYVFGGAFLTGTITANFTCYTCSYQYPATRDFVCVGEPDKVTTAKSVLCPADRLCVTRQVYSKALKAITSFNRDCQFPPVGTECDSSGDTTVCTYVCTSDYCNNQQGGQVESAVKEHLSRSTGGKSGPGNAADSPAYVLSMIIPQVTALFFTRLYVGTVNKQA